MSLPTLCAKCRVRPVDDDRSVCTACYPRTREDDELTMTKKILKAFRDGIPVDARQWTEADWRDLHEAMEQVKERIAARHRDAKEQACLDSMREEK